MTRSTLSYEITESSKHKTSPNGSLTIMEDFPENGVVDLHQVLWLKQLTILCTLEVSGVTNCNYGEVELEVAVGEHLSEVKQ